MMDAFANKHTQMNTHTHTTRRQGKKLMHQSIPDDAFHSSGRYCQTEDAETETTAKDVTLRKQVLKR